MSTGIKVGLALGSGASRGLAHIGVLEVLEKNEIPIDIVAGSSMGSVIGGLYCAGMSPRMMDRLACSTDRAMERKYVVDIDLDKRGLIKGDKIEKLIMSLTGNRNIESLKKPYIASTLCLEDNQIIYIDSGNLSKAIRASISIPGIFSPVRKDDKTYVDAGMCERVPVSILREKGADVVIAVDVGYRGGTAPSPQSMWDLIYRFYDIVEWQAIQVGGIHTADITLHVDTTGIRPETFSQACECIERGRKTAQDMVDEIKKVIDQVSQRNQPRIR